MNSQPSKPPAKKERQLPPGWRWVLVREVCKKIDYGYTASADFEISQPKFLRITDIQNNRVDWSRVPGCRIDGKEEAANKLHDGDIVFARTGATTGKSFLLRNPPRAVFASYLIRLIPSQDVVPEFLYIFFKTPDYWDQIRLHARGGAQPNVNASLLATIILPIPPLAEQKRIIAILAEQMAAVDRTRIAAEAQIEAIDQLPSALSRRAFSGVL